VVEIVKGMMLNIGGEKVPIMLCYSLLRMMIVARLVGVLLHLSLGFKKYRTVFCVVVGFTVMVYAIRRPESEWSSVMASAWCTPLCTTEKQGTFLTDFIFLGTEEYNWTIFLGTGTEECNLN
jgi:hypothetical protein